MVLVFFKSTKPSAAAKRASFLFSVSLAVTSFEVVPVNVLFFNFMVFLPNHLSVFTVTVLCLSSYYLSFIMTNESGNFYGSF